MPRKTSSFSSLYEYITNKQDKNESLFNFTRNTFGVDKNELINEFLENSELLKKRKDWNVMYHEIIALSDTNNLSREKQKEKLRDLAEVYLSERGADCLAFGGLHDEENKPLHYHIMLSANAVGQKNRHSLSPYEFQLVKDRVEEYALERYPELEQKKVMALDRHNQAKDKTKEKWQEASMKIRTGKMSKKDLFRERILEGFLSVSSWQNLDQELEKFGILQTNRKRASFLDLSSGKKYRVSTLGVEKQYDEMVKKLNLEGQSMRNQESKKSTQEEAEIKKNEKKKESKFRSQTNDNRGSKKSNIDPNDEYKKRAEELHKQKLREQEETQKSKNSGTKKSSVDPNDEYKKRAEALHKQKLKEQEEAQKAGYTEEDLKQRFESQQQYKQEDKKNQEEQKITQKMYKAMTKSKLIECILGSERQEDFMRKLDSKFLGLHRLKDSFYITDFETMESYPVSSLKVEKDVKKLLNYSNNFNVHGKYEHEPDTEYVKNARDLELKDHLQETAKEFIFGDFSHHTKREALIQSRKRMVDWKNKTVTEKNAEYESYNLGSKFRQSETRKKAQAHTSEQERIKNRNAQYKAKLDQNADDFSSGQDQGRGQSR